MSVCLSVYLFVCLLVCQSCFALIKIKLYIIFLMSFCPIANEIRTWLSIIFLKSTYMSIFTEHDYDKCF